MQHEMFLHRLRKVFIEYRPLIAGVCLIPLYGCDNGPKVSEICQEHTKICADLQEDNWCRKERREVLVNYDKLNKDSQDNNKYALLLTYETYAKCMDKASLIEHKKLKEKKSIRINNAINAKSRIKEMSLETSNSENALLLYYHWSRFNDKTALNKLLALEGTSEVETPDTQFNLATYYVKRNPAKTLTFLFHALELYKPEEPINIEIFKSLTTLFSEQGKYKHAYIWLKVLELYAPSDKEFNKQALEQYIRQHKLNKDFLDQVAESTLDNILEGTFVTPKH